jgi:hypothetical protein
MKTNFKDSWPVCHRCERTERKRQGRHDDVRPVHYVLLAIMFSIFVLGGAISDILSYWGV